MTEYYIWPRSDAWDDMKTSLEGKPWVGDAEKVQLLNRLTAVSGPVRFLGDGEGCHRVVGVVVWGVARKLGRAGAQQGSVLQVCASWYGVVELMVELDWILWALRQGRRAQKRLTLQQAHQGEWACPGGHARVCRRCNLVECAARVPCCMV
jgi:hypothetical protein